MHYKKENGQYNIDFGKFHNVYDVNTPSYSAKEIDNLRVSHRNWVEYLAKILWLKFTGRSQKEKESALSKKQRGLLEATKYGQNSCLSDFNAFLKDNLIIYGTWSLFS